MFFKHKVLSKYIIVIAGKKDDYLKMVDNPEVVDFVIKNKLNDNWALWYLRAYKQDPKVFSKDNQDTIAHYASMTHVSSVNKLRFEKSTSFQDGLKMFDDAEKKHLVGKKLAPIPGSSLSIHKKGKKFIDLGGGLAWWDLGDGKSEEEAAAMVHCGNKAEYKPGDILISLRKDVTPTHQEVLLTCVNHDGWLGELKGKGNYKPAVKYHNELMKLFLDKRIKGLVGGGHLPESNLQKEDLTSSDIEKLENIKPDFFHPYVEDLPKNKFDASTYIHSKDIRTKNKLPLNMTEDEINNALDSDDVNVRYAAIEHHNATENNIKKALDDDEEDVREAAIKHHNATEKNIDKALDADQPRRVREVAIEHPNATEKNIEKALAVDDEDGYVRYTAIQHHNATKEQIEKALADKDALVREAAISKHNATEKQIDKYLDAKDADVRKAAIRNHNATEKNIKKALTDKDKDVRWEAILNPNATEKNIDKALTDKYKYVRIAAIEHHNATEKNIKKALDADQPLQVRIAAISNKNATEKNINKALDADQPSIVRKAAISNPNATETHIDKALTDKNKYVRLAAINHPKATKEQLERYYKTTGIMPKNLLKSLPTKSHGKGLDLIYVITLPTEDNHNHIMLKNSENASEVLKERRQEDYEKRLPTMHESEVHKYYQSMDEIISNKAKDEWLKRQKRG